MGPVASGRCRRSLVRRASQVSRFRARQSYAHREFDNPEAETCWLSCLFQSLWHSVVFHSAFEDHLVSSKHHVSDDEKVLRALQQTWEEYRSPSERRIGELDRGDVDVTASQRSEMPDESSLVSSTELAGAFGEGYGDMSEALALLVEELSQSDVPAVARIGEQIAMVPLTMVEDSFPTPTHASALLEEWGAAKTRLIAVDLSLPRQSKDNIEALCKLWVPTCSSSDVDAQTDPLKSAPDLGTGHRLVSLVCFMHNIQHYVAFCRRQSAPSKCVFFNDLPALTGGAEKVVTWSGVPEMCGTFNLMPRLALYEVTPDDGVPGSAEIGASSH